MSPHPLRSSFLDGNLRESQSPSSVSSLPDNPTASPILSRPNAPFVGFRSWTLDSNDRLRPIAYDKYLWGLREPTRAVCATNPTHHAPESKCQCGMWAIWEWERTPYRSQPGYVSGAVLGWGRVQRHDQEGFRAEYAQVIGLALTLPAPTITGGLTVDYSAIRRLEGRLRRVAEKMDVPLLGVDDLKGFALTQGLGREALGAA